MLSKGNPKKLSGNNMDNFFGLVSKWMSDPIPKRPVKAFIDDGRWETQRVEDRHQTLAYRQFSNWC